MCGEKAEFKVLSATRMSLSQLVVLNAKCFVLSNF